MVGAVGCPAVGREGSSGAGRPPNPIWRSTCLAISHLQGASMWAWTKSFIFWAGSPQSHLVLCLTLKSHNVASFIPQHFHLSQGLAKQQSCSVSHCEWRQPVVGIYFHHCYYLLPLDACHACLPYSSMPNSIPFPCLSNFLTLEDSNLFSFLFFSTKKPQPKKNPPNLY